MPGLLLGINVIPGLPLGIKFVPGLPLGIYFVPGMNCAERKLTKIEREIEYIPLYRMKV